MMKCITNDTQKIDEATQREKQKRPEETKRPFETAVPERKEERKNRHTCTSKHHANRKRREKKIAENSISSNIGRRKKKFKMKETEKAE